MLINLEHLYNKYNLNLKGIIHIGAHELEEKVVYNKLGITNIVWIEGNKNLVNKHNNSNNLVLHGIVSDKDDEEKSFIITNNYQSSSILELKTHKQAHPEIHEIDRYNIKTITLDTLLKNNNIDHREYNFMNIDIQGAELLALKGSSETLNSINYLYLEVNVNELYEGCALLPEIDVFLSNLGFKRVETHLTGWGWGDAFYIKHNSV